MSYQRARMMVKSPALESDYLRVPVLSPMLMTNYMTLRQFSVIVPVRSFPWLLTHGQ